MQRRFVQVFVLCAALCLSPFVTVSQENTKPGGSSSRIVPRTLDGKVDLSGFWTTPTAPGEAESIAKIFGEPLTLGHSREQWFMTPWAQAQFDYNQDPTKGINAHGARLELNPRYAHCIPLSLPQQIAGTDVLSPFEIFQSPKKLVVIYEHDNAVREIHTDRRQHPSNDPLTQDAYWRAIQNFLRPGDVIVVEDGASSNGMGRLTLPADCTYITGAYVWCSIGYATGALLGAILATPGRRHILLTGEGSLQMTVQELSTVMRHGLTPFIFVINNAGYTVERAVLGMSAKYNDVANWRYSELPNVFSRDRKAETYVVQTSGELQKVLDASHPGMVFVESVMDKYDAPIDLIVGGHALADSDYGTPGPQAAADSQIPMPGRAATSS